MPVFSLLVRVVAAHLPMATFHVLYLAVVATFVLAAALLWRRLAGAGAPLAATVLFLAALAAPWAGLRARLPRGLATVVGEATGGVAGQYLLGGYLQPSEAGVLLVLAFALFAAGRPRAAGAAAGLACVVHPTYVLTGGFLLLGVATALVREGRRREAAAAIGVWLLAAGPVLAWTAAVFVPTAGAGDAAAAILARERLPHHALPRVWLDAGCAVAGGIVLLALVLWRRERPLVTALGVTAAATAMASVAVGVSARPGLTLLFPWRASVVILPVAYALVVAAGTAAAARAAARSARARRGLTAAAVGVTLGAVAVALAGLAPAPRPPAAVVAGRADEYRDPAFAELVTWVRRTAAPDAVFAVPVSATFAFESFRVRTGQPLFVDWKTHPYREAEVLAWWRRIGEARALARALATCDDVGPTLARLGVTHVVEATGAGPRPGGAAGPRGLRPVFENARFRVLARDADAPRAR